MGYGSERKSIKKGPARIQTFALVLSPCPAVMVVLRQAPCLSRVLALPLSQEPLWAFPLFTVSSSSSPREKLCMADEDSHSSAGTLPGPGTSLLSSSGPGLTSPPYTATPVDHDYVKCKKSHQQATPDGTVPVLNTVGTWRCWTPGGRVGSIGSFQEGEGSRVTRAILLLINPFSFPPPPLWPKQ